MAAPGPCALQSGAVDLHARAGAIEALLVSGHRVPIGHANLFERPARLHRAADGPHAQVLLLGG